MKKFDKVKRLGHDQNQGMLEEGELVIKEKMDGANFRFTVVEDEGEHKFMFGSRNVEYKIDGSPDYSENVDSRFKAAIEHVRETCDPERIAETFGTGYTFFGENMVKHSLEYEWDETPQFLGFDIYDHDKEAYMPTNSAYSFFHSIGLETAPIIARMPVESFDPESFDAAQESQYRDGNGEGVVIINELVEENDRSGFNTRAKLVTDEFVEKHKEATGAEQTREAIKGHEKLASKYCTDGRIKKHVHKMRDEGYELSMKMMSPEDGEGLYCRVAKDIVEEEWEEIAESNWKIDFKEFRNVVASQCAPTLKSVMQGEAA